METNITNMGQCLFLSDVMAVPEGPTYVTTIFTCLLNSVFSITATVANSVILWIIIKDPNLHNPVNSFLSCLALSDLVIGAVTQPAYVVYKIAELLVARKVSCAARVVHWVFGWICAGVSMFTITAIAMERFLKLHLHLRYMTVVTNKRALQVTVAFWLVSIAIILSLFAIRSDRYWTFVPAPIMLLNLVITLTSYWKIFRILEKHRAQIRTQLQPVSHAGLNMKRYQKSTVTAVSILGLLLFCYVPFFCAMVTRVIVGYTTPVKIAYECGATFVYLNSTLNPALYWRRIPDIRRAVVQFAQRSGCFCCTCVTVVSTPDNSVVVSRTWDVRKSSAFVFEERSTTRELNLLAL
ncbi:melanocyte-stimulating hormone receptor [Nematostella vectensis]|uniref:melanocyte-stimulating hormone receptor n=1 Tax=Nematostella vectensis TaxID=45351 RepID=UPI0020773083|nr:melanocyte-stimulating hormone receptor [Nematostella vectensis]